MHFPYYFCGDFLYFFLHVYIKINGYLLFLLQFGFFVNWLDYQWSFGPIVLLDIKELDGEIIYICTNGSIWKPI